MNFRALKTAAGRLVNYHFELRHGDRTVRVPVVAGVGRANRDPHEHHLLLVLDKLHRIGALGLLVDVGVNIGQTLLKYILVTGGDGRYVGFEPNMKAATYVDEIIRSNRLPNAQVVPAALGAEKKLAILYMGAPGSTDPGASISEEFRDASFYGAKSLVAVIDGDAAMQSLDVRDRHFTLKIDTEGSELDVVRGMQQTLRELRPFVIMEMLPPSSNFSEASHQYRRELTSQLKETMAGLGFKLTRIGRAGELFENAAEDGPVTHDYLFIPSERAGDLTLS